MTIENRTRDLPTCSAVPQPTALRRDPRNDYKYAKPANSNNIKLQIYEMKYLRRHRHFKAACLKVGTFLTALTFVTLCHQVTRRSTVFSWGGLEERRWSVAYRGGFRVFNPPPPPKFRTPSKIVPNTTRLWKLLKIVEFRTSTPQDVR